MTIIRPNSRIMLRLVGFSWHIWGQAGALLDRETVEELTDPGGQRRSVN